MMSFRAALAGLSLFALSPSAQAASITFERLSRPMLWSVDNHTVPTRIFAGVGDPAAGLLLIAGWIGMSLLRRRQSMQVAQCSAGITPPRLS